MTLKTPIIISGLTVATVSIPLAFQELQIHRATESLTNQHAQLADLDGINETYKTWTKEQDAITTHQALLRDKEERDRLKTELDALIADGAVEKTQRMTAIKRLEGIVAERNQALETLLDKEAFGQESRILSRIARNLALQVIMFMDSNALQFPISFSDMNQKMENYLETGEDGELYFQDKPLNQWELQSNEGTIQDYNPTRLIVIREREARFHNGKYVRAYAFGDGHGEVVAKDTLSQLDEFEKEQLSEARNDTLGK
jgi:hypothetical protein